MAAQSNAFSAAAGAALLARPLRANPAFELVLFDRLPAADRHALGDVARDPGHYGVLRPAAGSGLGEKLVDHETALLFLTLARPGALPAYVRRRLGDPGAAAAVALLVADGVLEIAAAGGEFVSGAAALPFAGAGAAAAGEEGEPAPAGEGRIAALSLAALRYGEALARVGRDLDVLELSLALYGYHRRPLTPAWRRRLPDGEAVRRLLGLAPGGAAYGVLTRHWREETGGSPAPPWLRWQPRAAAVQVPRAGGGEAVWKLYVSPAPEALAAAGGEILAGLAAAGAPPFKLGAAATGLLRPDKLVAYFARFDELAAAAAILGERLRGVAAHGVPFSAAIDPDGLLSWGVDPPAWAGTGLPWDGSGSWRLWLTHQLARALLSAVAGGAMVAEAVDSSAVAGDAVAGASGADDTVTSGAAVGGAPAGDTVAGDVVAGDLVAGDAAPGDAAAGGVVVGDAVAGDAAVAGGATGEPWRFALARLRLVGVDTGSWTPGARLWQRPEAPPR